jgi:hypothetical protein
MAASSITAVHTFGRQSTVERLKSSAAADQLERFSCSFLTMVTGFTGAAPP